MNLVKSNQWYIDKVGICSVLLIMVFSVGTSLAFGQIPITPATTGDCDSSYLDFCVSSSPPELNCTDIPQKGFTVLPPDPQGFDRDGDGIGCEA